MFGQSLLSAFGIACTTDTDQLFDPTSTQINSLATYQLNNATTSIPSNTYPGTASNITYTTGKFGDAAVFNGTSKIDITGFSNFGSTGVSISAWVNVSSFSNGPTIVNLYSNNSIVFGTNSSGNFFRSGQGTTVTSNLAMSTGTWHNVVMTADTSGNTNLYLDGVSAGSGNSGTAMYNSNNQNDLIGAYGTLSQPMNGKIDQVRIFNSVLPQTAVTALYNETTTTAQNAYITEESYSGIAYYKMSDATDQLGNYNGTATNVNFNTEGKFGFAGAFNGSSSVIDLGTSSSFSVGTTGSLSLSLWVKTTATSTGYLMSKANDATVQYEWALEYNGSQLQLNVFNTAGGIACGSGYNTTNINDGNWHHVSGVITNNTSVSLYIDNGNPITSTSWSGTTAGPFTISTLIGHFAGIPASTSYWEGDVDQIRIYDAALSAADVSTLYKEVECEPVAINALDHFNTVLYTGNGGTQSVTGVGFKPDFSWVKNRNTGGNSHELADVIRGVNNTLNSNTASGEYNNATYQFNSFDTDGITVTDDAAGNYAVNGNNETYVAWNWKAPLANLSTSFNGSNSKIEVTNSGNVFEAVGGFSASVWVNRNTTANQTILNKESGTSGSYGWALRYSSGSGYSYDLYDTSNNMVTVSTGANSTTGTWEHVVISFNNSDNKLRIYYNGGTAVVSSALSSAASSNTENFFIGARTNSGIVTDGDLAQVRIYSTAVTDAQVSDLYAEPAASNNTLNYPAGAGCIAAYPLQTDAVDLSGNYSGASSNVTFGQPGYLTGNTDGAIPSTVAANVEAGFSIVSYTATGSTATVGHGLGTAPDLILAKTSNQAYNWIAYSSALGSSTQLLLDSGNAAQTGSSIMASTDPTSTVFTAGAGNNLNYANGNTIIAYCFTSIPGYSRVGSYIGTGATGNFQYTGFQPSLVLIKNATSSGWWNLSDSKRGANKSLFPNDNYQEVDDAGTQRAKTFNSTGFTLDGNNGDINGSGDKYIFLAIA